MEEPVLNGVYRHFKGSYYRVDSIAIDSSDLSLERSVIYTALYGIHATWSRKLSEFLSDVPEESANPTGQKKRFELVTDFSSPVSLVSTNNLVKELKTRIDNPFMDYDTSKENLLELSYFVGYLRPFKLSPSKTIEEVVILSVSCNTFEECLKKLEKFLPLKPDAKIFRSITQVVPFDDIKTT